MSTKDLTALRRESIEQLSTGRGRERERERREGKRVK
jgi:hypothetical protein